MTFSRIRIPPHYGTIYAYYGIIILFLALQKGETLPHSNVQPQVSQSGGRTFLYFPKLNVKLYSYHLPTPPPIQHLTA